MSDVVLDWQISYPDILILDDLNWTRIIELYETGVVNIIDRMNPYTWIVAYNIVHYGMYVISYYRTPHRRDKIVYRNLADFMDTLSPIKQLLIREFIKKN
jgi:hypothetical protein